MSIRMQNQSGGDSVAVGIDPAHPNPWDLCSRQCLSRDNFPLTFRLWNASRLQLSNTPAEHMTLAD